MGDLDREILFSNEAFVIGMLQVVSGSTLRKLSTTSKRKIKCKNLL